MYNQNSIGQKKIWFIVTILFINLILISSKVVLPNNKSLLHNVFINLITPFQIVINNSINKVNITLKKLILLKDSHLKYLKINEENKRLKLEIFDLKRENEKYSSRLNFKITNQKFIMADLIFIDTNFPLSYILINKGKKEGVKKNMTAVNLDGDLIGKIVEPITANTSQVRLITSSIGGAGAYLKSNKLEGYLTGNNTKFCQFKYIIENKSVEIGDIILTSGTDNIFPVYIPIGKVIEVKNDYLEKKVIIEPFFIKKSIKHIAILENEE